MARRESIAEPDISLLFIYKRTCSLSPSTTYSTQVMQDSLGGNAKTLMFVNISPADYNQDETVTALTYATRVKLITNTAEKQQVGEG